MSAGPIGIGYGPCPEYGDLRITDGRCYGDRLDRARRSPTTKQVCGRGRSGDGTGDGLGLHRQCAAAAARSHDAL